MTNALAIALGQKKRSKYGNVRCLLDGFRFDAKLEMQHYCELKLREKAREIAGIFVHPTYPIQVKGTHVCNVEMDFEYRDLQTGSIHVVDVKGRDKALSKLKRKLCEATYPHLKVELVSA